MRKAFLAALLGSIAIGPGLAAEPAAQPAAPAQDYSKGFEKLFALGLPDVSTGRCVQINVRGMVGGEGSYWQYQLKARGNGWLLSESTNGPSQAVIGQATVLPVWKSDVLTRMRRSEAKAKPASTEQRSPPQFYVEPRDGRMAADWTPVNFTNDLAQVLARIDPPKTAKKPKSGEEDEESDNAASRSNSQIENVKQAQGPLFLMAAQAWKRGFTNEANRIAIRLFAISGDPRQVILAAYNSLADQQYNQVYNRFLCDEKWPEFSAGLNALLQRFPQGWKNRPGIQILATNVAARIANPVPEIKGDGISDEDRVIAAELAAMSALTAEDLANPYRSSSIWLLAQPSTNTPHTTMQKIYQRGVKSLPLLTALMDDGYLLPMDRSSGGGRSYSIGFISNIDGDEPTAKAFDLIQRPITRGELARQLLLPVLITGDKSSYEVARKSQDELRAVAADMAAKLAGKSPIELARVYFKEGTHEQKTAAVMVLLRSTETADIKLVEDMLADTAQLQDNISLLSTYVNIRGPAAAPLIRSLAAELGVTTNAPAAKAVAANAAPAEEGDSETPDADPNQENDYIKRQMKELLTLVSDQKLDSMLADIVSGRDDSPDQGSLLTRRLAQGDAQTSLSAILSSSLGTTNAETRVKLLSFARYLRSSYAMYGEYFDSQPVAQRSKLDLAKSRDQWLALLKDNRFVPRGSPPSTVAEMAAEVMEGLYAEQERANPPPMSEEEAESNAELDFAEANPAEYEGALAQANVYASYYARNPSASMLSYATGRRGREFLLSRARSRMAGEPVPPYPTGSVEPERRKALLKQLEESPTPAQVISGINVGELLWLSGALNARTNLSIRLAPLSLRIAAFTVPPEDGEAMKLAAKWKDGTVGRPLVDDLVAYAKERLRAGNPTMITVYRQPGFDGTLVNIEPLANMKRSLLSSYSYYMRDAPADKAVVLANMDGLSVNWVLDAPAPATEAAPAAGQSEVDALLAEALSDATRAMAKSGDKQRERFWKAVDALPRTNPASTRTIFLMGVKPGTFSKKELQQYGGHMVF
jgi:hypothetical protein